MNRLIAIVAGAAGAWLLLPLLLNVLGLGVMASVFGYGRINLTSVPKMLVA